MKIKKFLQRHKVLIVLILIIKLVLIFAMKKFIFNEPMAKHMQVPLSNIEQHLLK